MEKPRKQSWEVCHTGEQHAFTEGWNYCHDAMSTWLEGEAISYKDVQDAIIKAREDYYDNDAKISSAELALYTYMATELYDLITRKLEGKP